MHEEKSITFNTKKGKPLFKLLDSKIDNENKILNEYNNKQDIKELSIDEESEVVYIECTDNTLILLLKKENTEYNETTLRILIRFLDENYVPKLSGVFYARLYNKSNKVYQDYNVYKWDESNTPKIHSRSISGGSWGTPSKEAVKEMAEAEGLVRENKRKDKKIEDLSRFKRQYPSRYTNAESLCTEKKVLIFIPQ